MNKDKNRNNLSKTTRAALTTMVAILLTLVITIPLHYVYPKELTSHWVIAICIAMICPFLITFYQISIESKINFTEEQRKNVTLKVGTTILSIWYADFTFICMFMNWLIPFFILAGIYLAIMIYKVASVLIRRKDSTAYPNYLVAADVIIGFLLSILLIYKIPDPNLQVIVTSLFAALIGGLITLLGVMLTIKKSDSDRKDEEIKRAKPLFTFNLLDSEPTGKTIRKLCVPEDLELGFMNEVYAELENSEMSVVKFTKLFHDGQWLGLQGNTTMLPNKSCYLSFKYRSPLNIFLAAEDCLGREYYYHIKVLNLGIYLGSSRSFSTIREICEISKSDMDKLIKTDANK